MGADEHVANNRPSDGDLLGAIETHSVEQLRAALDGGLDPNTRIRGKSLVNWLTEMYSRGDGFSMCLGLLLDRGATLDDPLLASVLLNQPEELKSAIRSNPTLLTHRTSMVSAFTPLVGASLLHVAAEYGHVAVAQVLMEMGAEVNATAAITWGRGFEWETTLFDVTPISYAQFGLLPQVHRKESDIYANIRRLLQAAGRVFPPLENVPNRYL